MAIASEAHSPSSGERSPRVATLTRTSLPESPLSRGSLLSNSGRGADERSDSGWDDNAAHLRYTTLVAWKVTTQHSNIADTAQRRLKVLT